MFKDVLFDGNDPSVHQRCRSSATFVLNDDPGDTIECTQTDSKQKDESGTEALDGSGEAGSGVDLNIEATSILRESKNKVRRSVR